MTAATRTRRPWREGEPFPIVHDYQYMGDPASVWWTGPNAPTATPDRDKATALAVIRDYPHYRLFRRAGDTLVEVKP
jgi:hypothetical protein